MLPVFLWPEFLMNYNSEIGKGLLSSEKLFLGWDGNKSMVWKGGRPFCLLLGACEWVILCSATLLKFSAHMINCIKGITSFMGQVIYIAYSVLCTWISVWIVLLRTIMHFIRFPLGCIHMQFMLACASLIVKTWCINWFSWG